MSSLCPLITAITLVPLITLLLGIDENMIIDMPLDDSILITADKTSLSTDDPLSGNKTLDYLVASNTNMVNEVAGINTGHGTYIVP